jgi:hypothetical protein
MPIPLRSRRNRLPPGVAACTVTGVIDSRHFLAAYDEQLRTDAETPSAVSVTRHGPLRLVTFAGGRGFVTYRDLGEADAETIRRLVPEVLDHYRADPAISRVEWKTRGHDHAPGLHEALLENGFIPDEPESSAPAGWNPYTERFSRGSGVAPPWRSGAGAGSTAR